MSKKYADSVWPVAKLIYSKYKYLSNSEIRPIHYYNGNSILVSPIELVGGFKSSADNLKERNCAPSRLKIVTTKETRCVDLVRAGRVANQDFEHPEDFHRNRGYCKARNTRSVAPFTSSY